MELYARVNILDGRAVRLPYGDVHDAIALDDDPVNRAKGWIAKGADRLHIVDLDAAAYGDYKNRDLIGDIIKAVDVPVQVGGGIRSQAVDRCRSGRLGCRGPTRPDSDPWRCSLALECGLHLVRETTRNRTKRYETMRD
jgi:histidine biosynthesis protein